MRSFRFIAQFVVFALLLISPHYSVFAHGGEEHGDEAQKAQQSVSSSKTSVKTIETGQGVFKVSLTQMPPAPRTGRETQFEIEVNEVVEGGFGNGLLPAEGASIKVDFKSQRGELTASALNVHSEGRPGVYGIHYVFKDAGDYKVNFSIVANSGVKFVAEFPFTVEPSPINYKLYGLAGFWMAVVIFFGAHRYSRAREHLSNGQVSHSSLMSRLAPEYAVMLPIAAAVLILIVILTPSPEEPTSQAEYALSSSSGAKIVLAKETQLLFGVRTIQAQQKRISTGFQVAGIVRARPQSKAALSTPIAGILRMKRPLTVGDFVHQGDVLAVVEQVLPVSDQIALETFKLEQRTRRTQARDEADHSHQRLIVANRELIRIKKLYEAGAVSFKQVQDAEQQVQFASQEAAHAQQNLIDVGEDLKDPAKSITLKSPINAVITSVDFVNGGQVEAGNTVFTLIDLSTVWIEAQVFEADLPKIFGAVSANYKVPAINDVQTIAASGKQLFTIGASVNQESHTVPVYFEASNSKNLLRDGMAVEIWIDTTNEKEVLSVPQKAVVSDQGEQFVFVFKGGEQFERRVVRVNSIGLDEAEIISGIKPDERVVVEGLYQLRASVGK